ncbi:hypothetical protein L6452_02493 [Arctium lappa]|uniref:Uncharacterized protein n=1 Tax=Arctium lappa TaxID=4217 RepID=A0ACB9FKH7_ARCLA|nr:hypothetical protein L6452_02493 [Arctium lappa]
MGNGRLGRGLGRNCDWSVCVGHHNFFTLRQYTKLNFLDSSIAIQRESSSSFLSRNFKLFSPEYFGGKQSRSSEFYGGLLIIVD